MESLSSSSGVASDAVQRKKRQYRSVAEKRRIVEETIAPGASVALVARAHGVNANQLFSWRRLYRAGQLAAKTSKAIAVNTARLLPVTVSDRGPRPEITASDAARPCPELMNIGAGSIHIQFPKAQVRVEGSADPATLRVVLESLSR